ncbi:hypothetical protein NPIL_104891, partial [Nephila pilipes]
WMRGSLTSERPTHGGAILPQTEYRYGDPPLPEEQWSPARRQPFSSQGAGMVYLPHQF